MTVDGATSRRRQDAMSGPPAGVPCDVPGDLHPICRASPSDAPEIADVLADAFHGYPWTDWIVRGERRHQRLSALHRISLELVAFPYGSVWGARCPAGRGLVGAIAVLRPDRPVPPDVRARVEAQQADLLGCRADAAAAAHRLLDDVRPAEAGLLVATVGVAHGHRRRGVAHRLLGCALGLADELGVPAHLETSSPGNVSLYRSAGFTVTAQRRVAADGPDVWVMRRPPRTPQTTRSRESGGLSPGARERARPVR